MNAIYKYLCSATLTKYAELICEQQCYKENIK